MSDDHHDMWTPLERALAPFKSLARLNRQSVLVRGGESRQMLLRAERCRVDAAVAQGAEVAGGQTEGRASARLIRAQVQIGFSIDADAYVVIVNPDTYQESGVWNLERLRTDLGAAIQSGALTPDAPYTLTGPNGHAGMAS